MPHYTHLIRVYTVCLQEFLSKIRKKWKITPDIPWKMNFSNSQGWNSPFGKKGLKTVQMVVITEILLKSSSEANGKWYWNLLQLDPLSHPRWQIVNKQRGRCFLCPVFVSLLNASNLFRELVNLKCVKIFISRWLGVHMYIDWFSKLSFSIDNLSVALIYNIQFQLILKIQNNSTTILHGSIKPLTDPGKCGQECVNVWLRSLA